MKKSTSETSTILLVEDNPDDEELTIAALKNSGITNRVVVARDGKEALDFLFRQGVFAFRDVTTDPRLVLLDLKLPTISGMEVLMALRAHNETRFLPVVILTTSTSWGVISLEQIVLYVNQWALPSSAKQSSNWERTGCYLTSYQHRLLPLARLEKTDK
ncbi:MAG TPA: response regulator [Spirochaetales bacterium]|nr:response regulator [Spirochaetales bacterium]